MKVSRLARVRVYLQDHPNARIIDVMAATGLPYATARRYRAAVQAEPPPLSNRKESELANVKAYLITNPHANAHQVAEQFGMGMCTVYTLLAKCDRRQARPRVALDPLPIPRFLDLT